MDSRLDDSSSVNRKLTRQQVTEFKRLFTMIPMSFTSRFTSTRTETFTPVAMKVIGINVARDPVLESESIWAGIASMAWALNS